MKIFTHFLVGKGLSNDDVEGGRGSVFEEIRPPRAGFETGDCVKEMFGGATVVRLKSRTTISEKKG